MISWLTLRAPDIGGLWQNLTVDPRPPTNAGNANRSADASLPQKAGGSVSPMGRAYNAEIDLRFSGKVKYVLGKFE